MFHFDQVSLLITHYKRSKSLERLLASLQAIGCRFGEVIVSDDGSPEPHISYISELKNQYDFKFVTTPVNKGLGNNMNKGHLATSKPYVLYIQEDFLPDPLFPGELRRALQYMEADHSIDMTRFFSHSRYPYMKPFPKDPDFSLTYYAPLALKYTKIYNYSDLPHLRRHNFLEKFGHYREGIPGDRTEYWMCISYFRKKEKRFSIMIIENYSIMKTRTRSRAPWCVRVFPLPITLH